MLRAGRGNRPAGGVLLKRSSGSRRPRRRQQLVELTGWVIADARQHVDEIREGIDAARLTGRDERVQAGEVLAGFQVANKQEVLPSERDESQRAFRGVVVQRDASIGEETTEFDPMSDRVADRDPDRALRRMTRLLS